MEIIVTGDREWDDKETIKKVLARFPHNKDTKVIHGDCRGADKMAAEAAEELGQEPIPYPADWGKHGKAAGIIRNQEMLDEHPDAYHVLAFHGRIHKSRGTKDMMMRSSKDGRAVFLIPPTP
jgi:hypothetical protein